MRTIRRIAHRAAVLSLALTATAASASVGDYEAEVRTTAYGISHIKAGDWGSLGFGYGYVYARQNLCVLAREVVAANGRQAFHFGESSSRINEDFFYTLVNTDEFIAGFKASVRPELRQVISGYAAGYNRYLNDTGSANLPADCRDTDWVREISPEDLLRVYYKLILRASAGQLVPLIVGAEPPARDAAPRVPVDIEEIRSRIRSADPAALRELSRPLHLGSNMYGLGANATQSGYGMVLGNPHFPWEGPLRWYQIHLTIPGVVDVMGASLHGVPLVNIGFTQSYAWSHTVSTASRFTLFEVPLVAGNPTRYLYDGEELDMEQTTVSIEVSTPGGVETREHTFYRTVHGWVLDFEPFFGFPFWATGVAVFALGDANEANLRAIEQFYLMNTADDLPGFIEALRTTVGLPWVHTVAADPDGNAFYGDVTVVPNVSEAKLAACPPVIFGNAIIDAAGLVVLDGKSSACRWDDDADAPQPGIIGASNLPQLQTRDYVSNSNDNHWLTNPDQPLEGFSPMFGPERAVRSLRTRLGLVQVRERLAGSDGLGAPGFTIPTVQEALFGSRNLAAELLVDELVALCVDEGPTVDLGGEIVDVSTACATLGNWDRRQRVDSAGVHFFREFIDEAQAFFGSGSFPGLYENPFDANDPVDTPNGLADDDPTRRTQLMQLLARAVQRLEAAGISPDALWGDLQYSERNGVRFPIHGGRGDEGMFSVISASLDDAAGAYTPISSGNSYMQTVTWEDGQEGGEPAVVAEALLSYSQSSDPDSPHYADQTALYASSDWVRLPFTDAQIEADPAFSSFTLTGPRVDDRDNDGLLDVEDNCLEVANPAQRDTDGDGYGNFCDPDLDQDLTVDFSDLALLRERFFGDDPDADFNGDSLVNFSDLAIMKQFFMGPPGPSCD